MPDSILITGASGYAGRILAAAMLARRSERLVLPIRTIRNTDAVRQAILEEAMALCDGEPAEAYAERLGITSYSDLPDDPAIRDVKEIIHCAGCVDYFDKEKLIAGNLKLTHEMLKLGRSLNIEKFTFLSTAFSSGDRNGALIRERLHADGEGEDLTEYMKSKRQAELMVANSGLPFLILRPPVMIGDGRTGRYSGKPYGIVQFWEGWSRIILSTYRDEMHFVVPRGSVPPLLHQDSFLKSVLMARDVLPADSIIHITPSSHNTISVRDLYLAPLRRARPKVVYFYEHIDDVPKERLYPAARMFLEICAVNIEVSGRDWQFERTQMEALEARGLEAPSVTEMTVGRCFDYFAAGSTAMQRYFERYADKLPDDIDVIDAPMRAESKHARVLSHTTA